MPVTWREQDTYRERKENMLSRKRPWNGRNRRNVWNYFSLFISGIPVNTLRGTTALRRTAEHRSTIAFLTEQKLSLAEPSGGTRNVCKYTRSDKKKDVIKGKTSWFFKHWNVIFPALCLRQDDIKFQIRNRINWQLITASKQLRRYGSSPCIRIMTKENLLAFGDLYQRYGIGSDPPPKKKPLLLIQQPICCL